MRQLNRNHNKVKKWILYFIFLFASVYAQDNRLRLIRADVLENVTINGESIQYLKGNVEFKKGEMTMNCNWARFNKKTEKGFLF